MRIGVFVCHCGSNIAGTVDCAKVAEIARSYPDVVYADDPMYTCAEPGQAAIEATIHEHKLDGVVVASCSPRMHEPTFRRTVERAGLNRYMLEMANIREHVSWIGRDMNANTNKSAELVLLAVEKLRKNKPLLAKSFDVNKRVLVIGAGVAGIQAALDCADGGVPVVLVEREATIGGKMAKLDKTFPTVDCSACILGPKMVDVAQHSNITLHAYSEVEDISGYVGNFTVKIRKRTTYVDWNLCTGCGACTEKCPSKKTPDAFNELVSNTTAITIAFPQAIPKKAVINAAHCRQFIKGKCGVCAKICPTGAIKYDMEDEIITEEVGSIVAATGYDLMDWTVYQEYGGGAYPDVITSLQYERLLNASGPTAGHIQRPSDGREPKNIVFVQCVGSRDKSIGRPYCSGFCCMYTAKQAILTKDHIPDSQSYVFYMGRASLWSWVWIRSWARPLKSRPTLWFWLWASRPARAHPNWLKNCAFPTTATASLWKVTSSSSLWKPIPPVCIWRACAREPRTFPLPWPRVRQRPPRCCRSLPKTNWKATRRSPRWTCAAASTAASASSAAPSGPSRK